MVIRAWAAGAEGEAAGFEATLGELLVGQSKLDPAELAQALRPADVSAERMHGLLVNTADCKILTVGDPIECISCTALTRSR